MKNQTLKLAMISLVMMSVTITRAADAPAVDPYTAIITYEQGQPRDALVAIEKQITAAAPGDHATIEYKLIAALESEKCSGTARSLICKMLARIGSGRSVPALAKFLTDEKFSHIARFALENIADPAATEALRAALSQTRGKLQAGVIDSLGFKKDTASVAPLGLLVVDQDQMVAAAAVSALGRIGTIEAAGAINVNVGRVNDEMKVNIAHALLMCADNLHKNDRAGAAGRIYNILSQGEQPKTVKFAARAGLLSLISAGEQPGAVLQALEMDDEFMRGAALVFVRDRANAELLDRIVAKLPDYAPEVQAQTLAIIVDRKDAKLRPALVGLIGSSKDGAVRLVALEAMMRFAQVEDVELLAGIAGGETGEETIMARKVLEQCNTKGFKEAVVAQSKTGKPAARVAAIKAATVRAPADLLPLLAAMTTDTEAAVRNEARAALGTIGQIEQLPALINAMKSATDDGERTSAQENAAKLCGRVTDKKALAAVVMPVFDEVKEAPARAAMLRVLPAIGAPGALDVVRKDVSSEDEALKDAAVRALSDWPDVAAAPALLEITKPGGKQTHAVLAIRGYVRLARLPAVKAAKRVEMLGNALAASTRPDEKKLVIAGLAETSGKKSIEMLKPLMKEEALKDEATSATVKVAISLSASDHVTARTVLMDVQSATKREDVLKQIGEGLKAVESLAGCITNWEIAGPFMEKDKQGHDLIDLPLGPEIKGATVEWKAVAPNPAPNSEWQIDLSKSMAGNHRAAFAKAVVYADKDRQAMLEIGGGDGIIVWLNGAQILKKRETRGFNPHQDKINIDLKKGANVVMLKIIQTEGDWTFSARLRNAQGSPLDGLSQTAPDGPK